MTDQTNVAPAPGADEDSPHETALCALAPVHDSAIAKLDVLKQRLGDSLAKAQTDASHVDYAGSFLRDVELKVDEILGWIGRHV